MDKRWSVGLGIACVCLVVSAVSAFGGGYVVATAGGAGGEARAGSVGVEGGWLGDGLLLGVGLATVFTGGDWATINANPLLTYDEKRNNDLECYGAIGWAVAGNWRLVGTAGASFASHSGRTATSQGTTVEWDPEYDAGRLSFSGQLQYERHWLVGGGGYHNHRGGIGRIGFRF